MTTRQFLYEDETLTGPPAVTGLPEGYAVITSDGHLRVLRSGVFVDLTANAVSKGVGVQIVSATTTLALTQSGEVLEANASTAVNFALPAGLAGFLADGSYPIWQIDTVGTGAVTITPGTGVLINGTNAVRTLGPAYSSVVLRRTAQTGESYILLGAFT